MSKFTKIKLELAKLLSSFSELETDKAKLTWESDEDLKAGMSVYIQDENGEYKPAEDGEYITQDGKTVVVKDGVVEAINDPKAEVDKDESEVSIEAAEEPVNESPIPVEEEIQKAEQTLVEDPSVLDAIEKLIAKVAELEERVKASEDILSKVSKMSVAMSAQEEIEKVNAGINDPVYNKKIKNFIGK